MIDPRQPDYQSTPVAASRAGFDYRLAQTSQHAVSAPAVSVVTPFFNTGPVFHETAASLFKQSLQNFEWIIINDGSTVPASLAMLDEYRIKAQTDSRIRIIDLARNVGPGGGRNAGFTAAKAPYVFQLDADDLIEPTTLEKCAWYLAGNPQCAFVKGWTVGFDHKPHVWSRGFHDGAHFLTENVSTITAMIRRDVFLNAGGYDETIVGGMEDWDLWVRLASRGIWGSTIPEYLDWYRRRPNHSDTWQDWDGGARQKAFAQRLRERYPTLTAANFPPVPVRTPIPFEEVPRELPISNPLAQRGKRLLMIVPWLTMGGADLFNIHLIKLLQERGWEVSVVSTLAGDQGWMAQFTKLTPDVFVMPHFLPAVQRPLFIRYLIQTRQPDVVLNTNSEMGYLVLPYLRSHFPNTPFVDYNHMEENYWKNGGYPRYAAGCQEQLDLNIVSSHHLKQWMVDRGADPSRIEVCTTNEDTQRWKPDPVARANVRGTLGISDQTPVLLYAGRICEQKQPRVFASTILELKNQGLSFLALVAGDGVDKPFLEEFVSRNGLEKHVHFLGAVPNSRMVEYMAAADIFFLPSLWEGISLAIYEAMSVGLAIVGAAVGGQRELVTADCGTLIERGTHDQEVAQYVQALAPLIADPSHARQIGAQARRRIVDHYELSQMGQRMEQLLQTACALHKDHPRPMVPPGLGQELATRAVEYLRLHDLADQLWGDRERLRQVVGASAMQAPSVGAPSDVSAAEHELSMIERSRLYSFVLAAKRNTMYRAIARMRWGQGWDQANPGETPADRLRRIKQSRSYRMIQKIKQTSAYRMYALRKYGLSQPETEPSHLHGVSSDPTKADAKR